MRFGSFQWHARDSIRLSVDLLVGQSVSQSVSLSIHPNHRLWFFYASVPLPTDAQKGSRVAGLVFFKVVTEGGLCFKEEVNNRYLYVSEKKFHLFETKKRPSQLKKKSCQCMKLTF